MYLIWAESLEGVKVSPSLLLAHVLLMVRKEAAMFLRMSTGFGYAQVGDYTASLFYLFRCAFLLQSLSGHVGLLIPRHGACLMSLAVPRMQPPYRCYLPSWGARQTQQANVAACVLLRVWLTGILE